MTITQHCCEEMAKFLAEGKVAISYDPPFREYAIDLRTTSAVQQMYFCPWCGRQLPDSLRSHWFDILEHEFTDFDGFVDPRTPAEFKTDTWWKKRGL